jgi:folylpolyglutamate synthase/dihydropteroate synthase
LLAAANAAGFAATTADSVGQALELAAQRTQDGVVVVSGSVYLVGEARQLLLAEGEGQ